MPDLDFRVDGAEATPAAATPQIVLKLRIRNRAAGEQVCGILLRCQVRIDAPQRGYASREVEGLADVFGAPEAWSRSLRGFVWTQTNLSTPAFEEETTVDVPLPCSYDFGLTVTKYLHALESGEVPLAVLVNGTVFYRNGDGPVGAAPIPWTGEARYALPLRAYDEAMRAHYPDGVPLLLDRDVFDRLLRFRTRRGLMTWDKTIDALLHADGARGRGP